MYDPTFYNFDERLACIPDHFSICFISAQNTWMTRHRHELTKSWCLRVKVAVTCYVVLWGKRYRKIVLFLKLFIHYSLLTVAFYGTIRRLQMSILVKTFLKSIKSGWNRDKNSVKQRCKLHTMLHNDPKIINVFDTRGSRTKSSLVSIDHVKFF